jgi:hypothetical protein
MKKQIIISLVAIIIVSSVCTIITIRTIHNTDVYSRADIYYNLAEISYGKARHSQTWSDFYMYSQFFDGNSTLYFQTLKELW